MEDVMRKVTVCLVVAMAVIFGAVLVAQAASADEAKAMAEKAAVFFKANGKDKAIAEFNNPKGQFVKGDLYIVAHDFNGVVLAHGANAGLVGVNLLEQADPNNGKLFVKEEIEVAKTKGSGWVSYSWTNPATKKVQAKRAWVKRVEGQDYLVLCGVFQ
jgi:cytochrome c